MALDDILRAIRADTDAEIRNSHTASAAEATAIAEAAEAEAERVERDASASLDVVTDREVGHITDRAQLDARRASLGVIELAYQDALVELGARLGTIRNTGAYPDVLARLLAEGLGVLDDATRIIVDPADVELVQAMLTDFTADELAVEPGQSTAGGLDLATDDGRRLHNTFESRLARADGRLRSLVARELADGRAT